MNFINALPHSNRRAVIYGLLIKYGHKYFQQKEKCITLLSNITFYREELFVYVCVYPATNKRILFTT